MKSVEDFILHSGISEKMYNNLIVIADYPISDKEVYIKVKEKIGEEKATLFMDFIQAENYK
jgi:hypothetical protein